MNIQNGIIKKIKDKHVVETLIESENIKEDMLMVNPKGIYNHPRKGERSLIIDKEGCIEYLTLPLQPDLDTNTEEGDLILTDTKNEIHFQFNNNKIIVKGNVIFENEVTFNNNVEFKKDVTIQGNLDVKNNIKSLGKLVSLKGHKHLAGSLMSPQGPVTSLTGDEI